MDFPWNKAVWVNGMNSLLRWRDDHHMLPLLLAFALVLLVAIAAAAFWARGSVMDLDLRFASARDTGAYERVQAGRTSQAELAALGFDAGHLHAASLSGLGVQEYFMPRTSEDFDRLDPAVRACFDSPDRCTALVFPTGPKMGGGFMSAQAAPRELARFVFLLRNGRVQYKAMNV
jgi:hypothetical protein